MTGADLSTDWTGLGGALMLGLTRAPLPPTPALTLAAPDEAARALVVLSLLGQRRRLALPEPPSGETPGATLVGGLPDDPRPMLPAPARRALLRLDQRLDGETRRTLSGPILTAVAAAGHRPHIFDLPLLEPMLRAAADRLGLAERAWLARGVAKAPVDEIEDGEETLTPGERLAQLRESRRRDPAAAREDLASRLAGAPAKLRADLVATLRVGLTAADRDLLESLQSDRAQGVREAAAGLLARLPGSPTHAARLAAARACLKVESKGLLRRRAVLTFTPPPGAAGDGSALPRLFESFGLAALTDGLGIAAADLPQAVADPALPPLLARAALWDGDTSLATALLACVADPLWPGDLMNLDFDPALLAPEARREIATATFVATARFSQAHNLQRLFEWLEGPLGPDPARRLLGSPAWALRREEIVQRCEADAKGDVDGQLLPLAALMPPALAQEADDGLAAIPTVRRPRTTAFLAFLREVARLTPPPTA